MNHIKVNRIKQYKKQKQLFQTKKNLRNEELSDIQRKIGCEYNKIYTEKN